jgi:hypothetical protein
MPGGPLAASPIFDTWKGCLPILPLKIKDLRRFSGGGVENVVP